MNLREQVIKLAHDNPGRIRNALLPILKRNAGIDPMEEFERAVSNVESKLLREGFRRKTQLLSSGGVDDAFGVWDWERGTARIQVELLSPGPRGKFGVFFIASKDRRVKERFKSGPSSISGFQRAVGEAMMAATEWVSKFEALA